MIILLLSTFLNIVVENIINSTREVPVIDRLSELVIIIRYAIVAEPLRNNIIDSNSIHTVIAL